jgi:cytochrome c oxidase assembly factor CtaG
MWEQLLALNNGRKVEEKIMNMDHMQIDTPWYTWWSWHPLTVLCLVLLTAAYLVALWRGRGNNYASTTKQICLFLLGIVVLALTWLSPLERIADLLFTGHMLQHLLISFVAALLLIVGTPTWLFERLLSPQAIRTCWRWLTLPAIASVLFNANLWIWHAPPLFAAMMENSRLNALSQVLFLLTGILFWWPLVAPALPGIPSPNLIGKLIYLFLSDMPMVLLGAGLTFTPPLYAMYQIGPRLWNLSAATDQQLGGLLMWIPGGIFLIGVASWLFLRWMLAQERQEQYAAEQQASLEQPSEP